ncbi:PREDICTED: chaoptin [Ceratosolen solmsi marchali]|uniref:Chaoptin n=1 Tax=Ceratosolen solmsi marchali TaxID=326594 RepID=A0AAJ6YSN6_9HYME|nr:PREDICTED: chaoptin [Ceratosolen solmsi marchali]
MLLTLLLGCFFLVFGNCILPEPQSTCPKESIYIYPCICVHNSNYGIRVKCENTNLATLSIAFLNLGNERLPIEELIIYKCNIVRFYGPALYPLNVRILKFVDTPLKFIEEHSFLGVNRTLQELHLINSVLEKFPREATQILGNLTVLNIRGHKINELQSNIFLESLLAHKIERLEISNGTLNSLLVETLKPLQKLKWLDLHGNQLIVLKKNQFKGLKYIEYLDLSHNLINKLDSSHIGDLTNMAWFNLSHNAISDLKRGTFARNSLLKLLNLNSNKISKIDSSSFRGMRLMRRLHLNNNRIFDIGRGTFGTMTRLGTIDLSKNMIKKIDYLMFNKLQYVEHIDISENQVTIVEKSAFKDLYSTTMNLSFNAIQTIENHAFENCVNIIILDLSHNKLQNISKMAFDSATYATMLQLSYNYLTALNQIPLQNMTGLKILNVSHNYIQTIPRQTFPKLYELHTIDLSYNNISDIYNTIFQTLFNLRMLNLSHNSLNKIKPSTFGSLPTLLDLDLSYNKLNDISRESLIKLLSCRTLSLKHNELKKIFLIPISLGYLDISENLLHEIPNMNVWPSMNALLSLDLSYNRLSDNLFHGSFENLLSLRILKLQANNINKPPWEALSSLTSLQYIYLQDNNLTCLHKTAFGKLSILFELNLANNQLHNINECAFEGLLQLLKLNLTNNHIKNIPNGAFKGLVSLKNLDLSHNLLEKLDNQTNGLLDDCLSLETINLSHNNLEFFTSKTLPYDPWIPYKIKEVDLSYNSMSVLNVDLTMGTQKVIFMNLSHNNIYDIKKYVLGNITALQTLDLSYNKLSDLSDDVFILPKNLSTLIMNHNYFKYFPWNHIVKMSNLLVLDFEYNNFCNFDENLMKILRNGTNLKYTGNPLHCNCLVRPLRRWLDTFTEIPKDWTNLKCMSPSYIAHMQLWGVSEMLMNCSDIDILKDPKYDVSSDVKYRDLEFDRDKNTWEISWYVVTRKDTGDFYIVVRELESSKNIFEKDIIYKERSLKIRDLPDSNVKYELCILARDSVGNIKHFRKSQCRILDKTAFKSNSKQSTINTLLAVILIVFMNLC